MYYNPYEGQHFFSFLALFFSRAFAFFTGALPFSQPSSDELQIAVLSMVAASASLTGIFLILRRMTMLANAISHTILLGIVMAYLLSNDRLLVEGFHLNMTVLLFASLITGICTTFLTEFLNKVIKLQEDASIGLVFTSLFALGIILVTLLTRNLHIGLEAVMGNVDALHSDDAKLVGVILLINIFLTLIFFKENQPTTFDPMLARTLGISTLFFHYLLMSQVSATTIGAFRAVGVLMVLAFITGPVLTARLLTNNLKRMMLLSILLGIVASLLGVALSRHLLTVYGLAVSTARIVVCVLVALFLICLLIKTTRQYIRRKKLQKALC